MKILSTFILSMISLIGFSQEGPIKDYGETHKNLKFCLYPSTLRMINLSSNEDYYDMVNDVEKLLIYQLDSAAEASKGYMDVMKEYRDNGFEEYATIYGGKQTLVLLGSDSREEMVGVFGAERNGSLMFYLKGTIGWQKIPTLMNNFQENDMINIFNLGANVERNHGPRPEEIEEEIED